MVRHPLSQVQEAGAAAAPKALHLLQQLHKAPAALPAPGGQVRPGPEGLLVRRHEDGQRPPPGAGEGLTGVHIHRIHIGPLLPVYLDADKGPVEDLCHFGVPEGLPAHDVAPVAGGVADGEKDGLILPGGGEKCLLPPGIPVDRVIRVLEQVGGLFPAQAVFGVGSRVHLASTPLLKGFVPLVWTVRGKRCIGSCDGFLQRF